MQRHQRAFAAAAVAFGLAWPAVPVAAQEASRGWMLTAGGGHATQLDPGSSGLGSFSVGASAVRARSRTLSLGIEGGYDRHETFEERGEFWWDGTNITSSECPAPCSGSTSGSLTTTSARPGTLEGSSGTPSPQTARWSRAPSLA